MKKYLKKAALFLFPTMLLTDLLAYVLRGKTYFIGTFFEDSHILAKILPVIGVLIFWYIVALVEKRRAEM